jgi:hypothetical protein
LETSAGTSDHEPKSTTPLILPADEVTEGYILNSLGVDANLITFPFKPNAPWTTHQRRKKKKKFGNFSLDGSSHQTGDAAFTPATPRDLQ